MLKIIGLSIVALVIGSGAALFMNRVEASRAASAASLPDSTSTPQAATLADNGKKSWSSPPEMKIDPEKKYVATIDTNKGKIVVDLFAKDAPKTVNNFVFLAREDFYDGLVFHRVIPDFMIQGGDPTGTGMSGPGYQFEDEVGLNKPQFKKGSLAMANSGPDTNGSQFFITEAATNWLQGKHTVFGQVKEGQDVVHAIATAERDAGDRPKEDVVIKDITIEESGGDAPATQPK
jgi:cyclophilin family peptidyl-prolyl cis-trans isomerase